MNGRCENHLMDVAVNVCDSCYGEFCSQCLQSPKGRRHPLCTDCVLVASGVRGGTKVEARGEKRTAKARRAEILERKASVPGVFSPFDIAAETEPAQTDQTGAGRRRSRKGDKDPSTPVEAEPADLGAVERHPGRGHGQPLAPQTPAVAELEALRTLEEAGVSSGESGTEAAAETSTESTDPPESSTDAPPEPVRPEPAHPEPAHPEPAAQRVAQSDRQPAVEVPDGPATERESHSAAAPAPTSPSAQEAVPQQAAPRDPVPQDPVPEEVVAQAPMPGEAVLQGAAAGVEPQGVEATLTAAESVASVDAVTDPHRQGRRKSDAPGAHKRAVAPMVGEVRTIGGRRADDRSAAEAGDGGLEPVHPVDPGPPNAGLGVEQFDAARPARDNRDEGDLRAPARRSENRTANAPGVVVPGQRVGPGPEASEDDTEGASDVDSNGNWIPPALRGAATASTEG